MQWSQVLGLAVASGGVSFLVGTLGGVGAVWSSTSEVTVVNAPEPGETLLEAAQRRADEAAARDKAQREEEAAREAAQQAAEEEARRNAEAEARRQEEAVRTEAAQRAARIGATLVEPLIESEENLEMLRNIGLFGSHQIYEFKEAPGTLTVESVGPYLFVKGVNASGADRLVIEGVVTRVWDNGVEIDGRRELVYEGRSCPGQGRMKFEQWDHPWYFRGHVTCGSHHYVDLRANDAFLAKYPRRHPDNAY